jgi:hypothetical protein
LLYFKSGSILTFGEAVTHAMVKIPHRVTVALLPNSNVWPQNDNFPSDIPATFTVSTVTPTPGLNVRTEGLIVLWEDSDQEILSLLAAAESSTAASQAHNNTSTKGLSTGAKIAIGIVIPIVVILLFLGVFLLERRRRRRANAAIQAAEPKPEIKNENFGVPEGAVELPASPYDLPPQSDSSPIHEPDSAVLHEPDSGTIYETDGRLAPWAAVSDTKYTMYSHAPDSIAIHEPDSGGLYAADSIHRLSTAPSDSKYVMDTHAPSPLVIHQPDTLAIQEMGNTHRPGTADSHTKYAMGDREYQQIYRPQDVKK